MKFKDDTLIVPCNYEVDDIPSLTFNFTAINELAVLEANTLVGQ